MVLGPELIPSRHWSLITNSTSSSTFLIRQRLEFKINAMATVDDLIKIDMLDEISPDEIEPILSTTPFYKLDGGFNTRDLSDGSHTNLKQGYAFRSGSLENLTPQGQDELLKLGVTTIFDLRSMSEFSSFPSPTINGIDRIPATINNSFSVQAAEAGTLNLGSMYM